MNNTYLFIGDHKYWLMTDYNNIDPYNDEGDYVLNRARLYRDRQGLHHPARGFGYAGGLSRGAGRMEHRTVRGGCHNA